MGTRVRAALCVALVGLAVLATPAGAVRTTTYADWAPLAGTPNNYTTTVQVPVTGFPEASVTSDSRAGNVGVQSGASVWLNEGTPVGQEYGTSRDRPYLALRPRADNAASPSVTTYTFEHPTPATGWMVAFSDVDADQVRVSAKDAAGAEVSPADLGFQGGFNFCEYGAPRPSTCSTSVGDVPSWNPTTQVLVGNPAASDTVGPTGWFEPSVPLSSLTVAYTRRAGFPLYATHLAAVARTLSGTVTDVSTDDDECPVTGVTVRLLDPYGEDLGTRTPDATGAYSFGQVATQPGYRVVVEPPTACAAVGGVSRTVSTATADATAAFSVRQVIPQPVSGTVRADGSPLAGVTVTLNAPDGGTKTTTTAADGSYLFDENPIDEGYYVSIDVPDGYDGPDQRAPFDIDATPITAQDFALTANPDVSGTVSGGGAGLGGVTVTLTPATGPPVTTVTAADGSYTFARVPAGTYDISVQPPVGFDPAPPLDGVVVAAGDVTGQDFALTRPGAIGGAVVDGSDDDAPVGGAEVTVDGPGDPEVLTTDSDGQYFLDGLDAGTYEISLTPPAGFEPAGPLEQTTSITDDGEVRGGIDFRLAALAAPSPTPVPTPSPSASPGTPGSSGDDSTTGSTALPATGSDVTPAMLVGGLLLLVAGVVLVGGSRRLGRRTR